MPKTLFDKLWQAHHVGTMQNGDADLIYIDRIFLHERTGSFALAGLTENKRQIRHPAHVFCTMDHIIDTFPGRSDQTLMPNGKAFIISTREAAQRYGLRLFDVRDADQGISHIVAAEQGIALPGLSLVCPDSHTCTLGGLGLLAWGIGSSEAEHALATSTLVVHKPKTMRVNCEGHFHPGVTAKDLALALIHQHGTHGGNGYAIEFSGSAISTMPVEARMTLCNMAVEFSAFTALIAPDALTCEYIKNRTHSPQGQNWSEALKYWQSLHTDTGAQFDHEITIDVSRITPTVTWGTSPEHAAPIDSSIPDPSTMTDPRKRQAMEQALEYIGLKPGQMINSILIDAAFIGSCTNSRISDLRTAASILEGKRIADGVRAVCVPGSMQIKYQAEQEGLDQIFKTAGFEWRESGCSMCFYAGGETFGPGVRVITSTNRNFEGRQGPGTRSHLASPAVVAASAICGRITDPANISEVEQNLVYA